MLIWVGYCKRWVLIGKVLDNHFNESVLMDYFTSNSVFVGNEEETYRITISKQIRNSICILTQHFYIHKKIAGLFLLYLACLHRVRVYAKYSA